jgi:hypothetical protein
MLGNFLVPAEFAAPPEGLSSISKNKNENGSAEFSLGLENKLERNRFHTSAALACGRTETIL